MAKLSRDQRRRAILKIGRDRVVLLSLVRALVRWFDKRAPSSQQKMRPAMWNRARVMLGRMEKEVKSEPDYTSLAGDE